MIANPTTLILGAGASAECGYPTGAELRRIILDDRHRFPRSSDVDDLRDAFRLSLVPSIDAFLMEPANKRFVVPGRLMIASALLPYESVKKDEPPHWVQSVFNAVRSLDSDTRKHRLRIVTFNYDLSLEYYLFHAFRKTYDLDEIAACQMLNAHVEFIHVYGQLGVLAVLGGSRNYGGEIDRDIEGEAARQLRIIERDEGAETFKQAKTAIAESEFLAILGFGYDRTNCENLNLQGHLSGKNFVSTGFGMGFGMRGYVRLGIGPMLIGSAKYGVSEFLEKSGFMRWADTPGMTSNIMMQVLKGGGDHDSAEFYMA